MQTEKKKNDTRIIWPEENKMENNCFGTHLCQLSQITVHYSAVQQSDFFLSKGSGKIVFDVGGRDGLLLLGGDFLCSF